MKNAIYILGVIVLVIAGYQFLKKDDETVISEPIKNAALQTQPQNEFPLQKVETPRVDNADQPWYGGVRSFISDADKAISDFGMDTSLGDMTYNTSGFWQDLKSQYIH